MKLRPFPIKRPKDWFVIRRTSGSVDKGPCEGAVQCSIMERAIVNDDGIILRGPQQGVVWAMKVPDIVAFVKQHGECVVSHRELLGYTIIEIYDDYRE